MITMPSENDNTLEFTDYHQQLSVLFVIYADFEEITEKVQTCQRDAGHSYTHAYKVVCHYDDKFTKPVESYRGHHAVHKCLEKMIEETEYFQKVVKENFNKPLIMTRDEEVSFRLEDHCDICE